MDFETSVFDNVKFEKQKAMARFNRFRKIAKLLQFFEVLVALALISWSSTLLPRALKLSGDFLFELAGYLFNPHVVFLIGNVIIVSLFVLCREKNDAGDQKSGSGDLYADYVRHSEVQSRREVSVSSGDNDSSAEPEIKVMISASAAGGSDDEEKILRLCSEEKAEECDPVATAIETATKQIQKFQRTQSGKLKRDISVKPEGELRRSETVTVRPRTERRVMTSFDSVDTLSNEEFNLTIDAFIKKHQKFLMEQKLAENAELKKLAKINRNATLCQ